AAKAISSELRKMGIHRKTGKSLSQIAEGLNPKLRGWISCFGKYGGAKFKHVLHLLNIRLYKWVRWRYKLRGRTGMIIEKVKKFYEKGPNQSAHWSFGIRPMKIT
ncbi:hypothetical protein IID04_07675, partial [PVC group bacterium]|nr:hypothetical protein [PVC group bacterium]